MKHISLILCKNNFYSCATFPAEEQNIDNNKRFEIISALISFTLLRIDLFQIQRHLLQLSIPVGFIINTIYSTLKCVECLDNAFFFVIIFISII